MYIRTSIPLPVWTRSEAYLQNSAEDCLLADRLQNMSIKDFDSTVLHKVTEKLADLIAQLVSECQDQAQQLSMIR